jgi:hypothetical protein
MKLSKHFSKNVAAVGTQKLMMASTNNTAQKILHCDAEETSLRRRRKTSCSGTRNIRTDFGKKTVNFGIFSKSATKRTPNRKMSIFAKTATKTAKKVFKIRGLPCQTLTQNGLWTL